MKKKKNPLLPMVVINRFERSCGTFKRGKGRNPMSLMTLGKFARGKINKTIHNNDHGVDVNIIMVIYLRHF
jgi:hypothetical protein